MDGRAQHVPYRDSKLTRLLMCVACAWVCVMWWPCCCTCDDSCFLSYKQGLAGREHQDGHVRQLRCVVGRPGTIQRDEARLTPSSTPPSIGPADYNYDETLSTLRYANRAKNIKVRLAVVDHTTHTHLPPLSPFKTPPHRTSPA